MKGDSLKTALENAVKAKYPGYLTYKELDEICDSLGYKRNNGERRFRFDKANPSQYVPNVKVYNKGAIAGYKWIGAEVPRTETPTSYGERLKDLLKRVPKTWDNAKVIGEISDAINSRFEWKQKSVLDLYDKRF